MRQWNGEEKANVCVRACVPVFAPAFGVLATELAAFAAASAAAALASALRFRRASVAFDVVPLVDAAGRYDAGSPPDAAFVGDGATTGMSVGAIGASGTPPLPLPPPAEGGDDAAGGVMTTAVGSPIEPGEVAVLIGAAICQPKQRRRAVSDTTRGVTKR